jgi:hypothetical protein
VLRKTLDARLPASDITYLYISGTIHITYTGASADQQDVDDQRSIGLATSNNIHNRRVQEIYYAADYEIISTKAIKAVQT